MGILQNEASRRLMWRMGRKLYSRARGELSENDIATNGETYVQACVLKHVRGTTAEPLTIFDVGANLGEWTRELLEQLPSQSVSSTRVLMFEPVPGTFEKLQTNIDKFANGPLAQPYPLAMSNEVGEAEMVVLSETGGTNSLEFDDQMASKALDRTKIEKTTLDLFCKAQGIEHIHLLKCDTEGHDAHALEGARELLQASAIDAAQFEYNHRWIYARSYLKDMFDLVEGLPYRIGRICPDHIEIFEGWHFELERYFEGNYLIIREPALGWFDIVEGKFDVSNTYA
jgi:FkbM family methyltransferase